MNNEQYLEYDEQYLGYLEHLEYIYSLDRQWEAMKQELPVGHKLYGSVVKIEVFGVFLYIGYEILHGHTFSGLVDIITKSDEDSSGLPIDYSLWPNIGEKMYCKVIGYRDSFREVSLRIVDKYQD